jgi:biotin operon repressor
MDGIGVEPTVVVGSAVDTATLIAAAIAAAASVLTLVPAYLKLWQVRARRNRLTHLLAEGEAIRSLEWIGRRLGMSETEVAAMLPDVNAHGVRMEGGKEGAALDSRHQGG